MRQQMTIALVQYIRYVSTNGIAYFVDWNAIVTELHDFSWNQVHARTVKRPIRLILPSSLLRRPSPGVMHSAQLAMFRSSSPAGSGGLFARGAR